MTTPAWRRAAAWSLGVLAALALGAGSAWWLARRAPLELRAGPWVTTTLAGSAQADPWTRARVALAALLALNRSETMYYLAATDSQGRALRSRCRYRVEGVPPPARWWSVTAYAEDHFLFDHPSRRYSLNGSTARLDTQGRFALVTGPQEPTEPGAPAWLPTPGDRGLVLALRAYNPDPGLSADPRRLDPPRITAVGACA